ncbi:YajG family lipoprotein [Conservatibacter flavescens]|uniref:Lipoprotein n=1 Tax=Conservatibacter flavescens TaxID=28161 RepID=A0A2M8S3C3_9PAST|nr:YajG family lipoprotein [Conservatibacter flavescens]PJG85597.1 hypothetical protein CVP05_05370 [Conservatibacter flavescens]
MLIKKMQRFSLISIAAASLFLTACQSPTSNTITFTPPAPTAQFNTANQNSALLNVFARDLRAQPEISSYTSGGSVIKLTASPSVSQLFQQVVQQDLNSKGFRIAPPSNANANIAVNVKDFYAKVEQGDLRYKISSNIQLEIQVQGSAGQYTKNIGATRTQEGAFSAKKPEIQKVLTETVNEVIQAIYQDQEISQAIHQYAR